MFKYIAIYNQQAKNYYRHRRFIMCDVWVLCGYAKGSE